MDDALKKVNQEGKRASAYSGRSGGRTLVQELERLDTQVRLSRRRMARTTRLDRRAGSAERTPGGSGGGREAAARVSAAAPLQAAGAADQTAGIQKNTRSGELRRSRESGGAIHSPSDLYRRAVWEVGRLRHRLHRIRREQRAHRFPESDHFPVQVLLSLSGMLPMLSSHFRERTWGRRKAAIHRFGRIRAWLEHKKVHPGIFWAAAGAVAVVALFFSFYTFGTTVTYNGEEIAKVSSELTARRAASNLERVTRQALGGSYSINSSLIRYSTSIMARGDVLDGSAFEEELSQDIGLVTYGYGLYVDGDLIGVTPYKGALEELLQQLKDGIADENTISCDFQEAVNIKSGYFPSEKVMNLGYLAETLYSTKTEEVTYTVQKGDTWSEIANSHSMTSSELLAMNPGYNIDKLAVNEVLTLSAAVPYLTLTVTERERYVEAVPYDISYTDSAYLYKGDTKVLSAGTNGSADVVANVVYVNGEETQRTVLSYVTLVDPITEQQARGTKARPTWLPTGTFRWPCSGNLTSRFGYRNLSYSYASKYHEGIDIANRRGTPIYAADGGTVTYSGWMSGYGYLVIINHGNGYETYYGHNSSLLVSVGQHVYKGQQVAKMGSTGNSTGNHCHFGVYYNGVAKNPLNYLS